MKKIITLLLCIVMMPAGCSAPSSSPESHEVYNPAEQLLNSMSLEEKIAQMFIARCPSDDAAALANEYQIGGYILFATDFKEHNPNSFKETTEEYQKAVKIPMFIAVDEEGGTVNRVSKFPQFRYAPFSSPRTLYEIGGIDLIKSDTKEKSDFLLSLGINLNFAPVCDISQSPDDFMYERSVGLSPQDTAEYAKAVVSEMKSAKIGSVLKHFPGYGANLDTHTGMAIDKRPYESFIKNDFLPFRAGIESGADMVLVSHTIVECMDSSLPVSLSPSVHNILRNELGFDGIIITDDISMGAIGEYTSTEDAAVLAVMAGNDIICSSDFTRQIPAVISAVKEGKIPLSQIDKSIMRILHTKEKLGILKFSK